MKLAYNLGLKQKARELRKAGNLSEVLLWNKLKKGQMLGFDFTRQQIIGNYIVDFHCSALDLVIEIDGESHNFKGEYDEIRDEFLKSLGLEVLHFKDIDVKKSLIDVMAQIESWVKRRNTPSRQGRATPFTKRGMRGNTPSRQGRATPFTKRGMRGNTPSRQGRATPFTKRGMRGMI